MQIIGAEALEELLDFPALIEALREMFRLGCESPTRHHHTVDIPGGSSGTLLIMPAWQAGGMMGVKTVTIFADNAARGLPSVLGQYYLMDALSGEPLALIEGTVLTRWRTAAASALASDYLSRQNSERLLMVGSGSLAPHLIRAHATIRPIREVRIWSRTEANAEALATKLNTPGLSVTATVNLEDSAAWADIISCATLSGAPLIQGAWLQPGVHLDLVGAFRADMRETDDQAMARARIYVDTKGGALAEGGDILLAIKSGAISEADIQADMNALTSGGAAGRGDEAEITLFKSVGAALEDLAAAKLAYQRHGARPQDSPSQ
ncbi:MAG: ornithine cyclodeaminase family protein [Rhodospirillaceae bacterium]|nr:ornithine cyclodeaminase family protein [Rhodospirillaceae bacterium]MBT5037415.1 ornithine cyclodeaminase family protein [Rhodospirillaceae bacterium]MBT5677090.1 ornithine cyclodeaminase family protein [Rhodospirillaceae bacterium]MBT5779250.1 ornithine cyclodeaminase family protein [Rhodospirillaceae bacterium]MBT6830694.1 ornithine cyclodeaminase family protein [Rhodospirillaceae bacterium]